MKRDTLPSSPIEQSKKRLFHSQTALFGWLFHHTTCGFYGYLSRFHILQYLGWVYYLGCLGSRSRGPALYGYLSVGNIRLASGLGII